MRKKEDCSCSPQRTGYVTLKRVDFDGPDQIRQMRHDGTTMADIRTNDGTWIFYDRVDSKVYVTYWQELPGQEGYKTRLVREVRRELWKGVL